MSAAVDAPGWRVERHRGSAAALHALEIPVPAVRTVWVMELTRPALVLGSTQRDSVVTAAARADPALDVVQRRSGGGAVLLDPEHSLWVDVLLPRDDPLWIDDVGRSFDWLGEAWVRALRQAGVAGDAQAFPGPLRRTAASDLVCFAGLGPGEVTIDGHKAIGLSQRRNRSGARFQCLALTASASTSTAPAPAVADIVPLLELPADREGRLALAAHLTATVTAVPVPQEVLVAALVEALPA